MGKRYAHGSSYISETRPSRSWSTSIGSSVSESRSRAIDNGMPGDFQHTTLARAEAAFAVRYEMHGSQLFPV
jgi:hypothetical protein